MNDDLLRRLGDLARTEEEEEQRRLDPRWDALAAGALPPAEVARLEAEARQTPEGRAAWEAFRPLDPGFRERLRSAARRQVGAPESAAAPPAPASERPGAAVLPWVPRRRRLAAAVVAMTAAVAAMLLVVLRPAPGPLPPYQLGFSGGERAVRGGPAGPSQGGEGVPVLRPGSRLELVLRPQRPVGGRVAVAAFRAGEGEVQPWPVPLEIAASGAVRVAGVVGEEIPLPPGEWDLILAVGRPRRLPDAAAIERALGDGPPGSGSWTAHRLRVRMEP